MTYIQKKVHYANKPIVKRRKIKIKLPELFSGKIDTMSIEIIVDFKQKN